MSNMHKPPDLIPVREWNGGLTGNMLCSLLVFIIAFFSGVAYAFWAVGYERNPPGSRIVSFYVYPEDEFSFPLRIDQEMLDEVVGLGCVFPAPDSDAVVGEGLGSTDKSLLILKLPRKVSAFEVAQRLRTIDGIIRVTVPSRPTGIPIEDLNED